jgi:HK97 family phage major capsid protein
MATEMSTREQTIRDKRAELYQGTMVPILMKLDEGRKLTVEDRKAFDDAELELQDLDADLDLVVKASVREKGRDETAETRGVSRDQDDTEEAYFTAALIGAGLRGPQFDGGTRERVRVNTDTNREAEIADYYTRGAASQAASASEFDAKYTRAFLRFMGLPHDEPLSSSDRTLLRGGSQRAELDSASLQTVPGQGGYMIPQGFWANLQIALKQYGGILPLCNLVKTASGNEMPWPTANPTGVIGQYITEANQVGFTDYTFGQGILYAWTITSGVILASLQLINDSAFNVDQFVSDRMGEAIGRKIAAELWSGAGSASKALTGLTTAISANGGSGSGSLSSPGYIQTVTGSKIFTLNSPSTAVQVYESGIVGWNDLTRMIGAVDVAYRQSGRCTWVMNDTQVQLERTLTDGFGHPLWEPNTQAGQPDVILGYPVTVDNNSPSVSTASAGNVGGGITFGDFKTAMVVRQVNMAGTMRLTERYADYLQVGYLGYVRMDSQPNDLRAVVQYETLSTS